MKVVAGLNILLGLAGFTWLLLRTTRRRSEYPREVLMILYLSIVLFFGLLSTSIVSFFDAEASEYNAGIITIVKVYALFVLWKTFTTKFRTGTRQADGNPNADQNKDIP